MNRGGRRTLARGGDRRAWAAIAIGVVIFVAIAAAVRTGVTDAPDRSILLAMRLPGDLLNGRSALVGQTALDITALGSPTIVFLVVAVAAVLLSLNRRAREAVLLSGCAGVRLRELFAAASELAPAEQRRFLDEECGGQPELRRALEDLLQADESAQSNTAWQRPALNREARFTASASHSLPFDRLGPYRILERIGSGGMGVVYLAVGDYDGVHKRVAIKAIPSGGRAGIEGLRD